MPQGDFTADELLELQAQCRQELLDEEAEENLGTFIPLVSPKFRRPEHLAPLLKLLDRAMREPVFACVSVPPRHFKTETLLHGVIRMMRYQPERMSAYTTYSGEFAERKSRRARMIASRAGITTHAVKGASLFNPAQTLSYWQTAAGGGLISVGRGGPLTGDGVSGVLVIDDPYSNREEAESVAVREHVWDWFTDVAMTRVEPPGEGIPGGSCIVTHTRWHEDDLIGRLSQSEDRQWEFYNLPALAIDDDDPLGRARDEALCPWKWPAEILERRRRLLGEYTWWSMYQGMPRPRGSKLFGNPKLWTGDGGRPHDFSIVIGVDCAGSSRTAADHTAVAVLKVWRDSEKFLRADVLRVYRMQIEIPSTVDFLLDLQRTYPSAPLVIEAQELGGKSVAQMLRRINRKLDIHEVTTTADKFTRAQPAAAAWSQGRLRVPDAKEEWIRDYLSEMNRFTGIGDKEDDQVDATTHAWNFAEQFSFGNEGSGSSQPRAAVRSGGY